MESTGSDDVDASRLARRALLKKAAIAGAAAWTAPVVLESVTNPAGALTCAAGSYHVIYQSTLSAPITPANALGCSQDGTNVAPTAVGLTVLFDTAAAGTCGSTNASIAHIASAAGNCRPVVVTLSGGCNCTITSVYAHVHNRSGNDCPQTGGEYCWAAGQLRTVNPPGPNNTYTVAPLRIVTGSLGSTSVTVQPNYTNIGGVVCEGETGIHWGSPDAELGRLVVNVTCT